MKHSFIQFLHKLSIAMIILCGLFLIKWLIIDPFHSNQTSSLAKQLYSSSISNSSAITTEKTTNLVNRLCSALLPTSPTVQDDPVIIDSNINDPAKISQETLDQVTTPAITDEASQARSPIPLPQFDSLLALNDDVKGWIKIDGTNIDYPVLQSDLQDSDYYLTHNINKEEDRYGSIMLDASSSIEPSTQCLLLHGHNMTSSGTMFHELINYNDINFLVRHPIIHFNSLYEESDWIIFAVFKTNGSSTYEPLFAYQKGDFDTSSDFLNFVYQIKLRSIYQLPVMITDTDQMLLLSTCSYELKNYRTVIAAVKVNDFKQTTYDETTASKKPAPLYPDSWYEQYGGIKPEVTNFEQALANHTIDWYYTLK